MSTLTIQTDKVVIAIPVNKTNEKPILIGLAIGLLIYVALLDD